MSELTERLKRAIEFDESMERRRSETQRNNNISMNFDVASMMVGKRERDTRTHALVMAMVECMEALECNTTFHRLGGIDDCEPCKALDRLKLELVKCE
jgi:hypothetical protein